MIAKLVTNSANLGIFHCPVFESQVLLQWHYNELDGVSNHQPASRVFVQAQIKKTSKLRVNDSCEENPPVTDGFPSKRTNHAENISICWRHHDTGKRPYIPLFKTQHQIIRLYPFEFILVIQCMSSLEYDTKAMSFWSYMCLVCLVLVMLCLNRDLVSRVICCLLCDPDDNVRCYFAVLHKPSNLFSD